MSIIPALHTFRLLFENPVHAEYINQHLTGIIGPVGNYYSYLTEEEKPLIATAVIKRKNEFSTGRHFARLALRSMGFESSSILVDRDRSPIWPTGTIGSISHSKKMVVVVLSEKVKLAGVGIDVEEKNRLTPNLYHQVLTDSELDQLVSWSFSISDPATLIFSAKEAVYKAVNPIVGLRIGHKEVTVSIDPGQLTFCVEYIGADQKNKLMNFGTGIFNFYQGQYICLFKLPFQACNLKNM